MRSFLSLVIVAFATGALMGQNDVAYATKDQQGNETRSEPEAIFAEANRLAEESNTIADRCLTTVEQSTVVGETTMGQLKKQRAQIEKMSDDLETVDANLEKSKRKLRSIGSVWGALANTLTPSSYSGHSKRKPKKVEEKKEVRKPAAKKGSRLVVPIEPLGNQPTREEAKLIGETRTLDRKLDQIDSHLDDLHALAVGMGREITSQSEMLDGISRDINRTTPKITKAINQCGDIVR